MKSDKMNFMRQNIEYSVRAANNSRSSDIGRPKFASVRQNPTCVQTLCPENFFIVNHFAVSKNKKSTLSKSCFVLRLSQSHKTTLIW